MAFMSKWIKAKDFITKLATLYDHSFFGELAKIYEFWCFFSKSPRFYSAKWVIAHLIFDLFFNSSYIDDVIQKK